MRKQQGGLDVYQLNPRVGLRYFPKEMERIMPQPGFQIFAAEKPTDTARIFVLGGSTAAGFPYPVHGSFANLLRLRLAPHLPDLDLEVVNCGITAINSYAVLDFVEELRRFDPDLFVVYAGHNEFYGALGPASRVAFGRSRAWVQSLRWLVDLRISRLIGLAVERVRGDPEPVQGRTLMGAMVGQTGIREGDPIWTAAMEGYEANLDRIVDAAGGAPVVLCEVVSNLRDQRPFQSLHRRGWEESGSEEFAASLGVLGRDVDAAYELLSAQFLGVGSGTGDDGSARYLVPGDAAGGTDRGAAPGDRGGWAEAAAGLPDRDDLVSLGERARALAERDPEHAETVFTQARAELLSWVGSHMLSPPDSVPARGVERAPSEIRDRFFRARDLDAICFRAPSEINAIVRRVAERWSSTTASGTSARVLLVPTEARIEAESPFGIPGRETFVEHLHFTTHGADQVARAIVRGLGDAGVFGSRWRTASDPTEESIRSAAGLTPLDDEIAERRIFHLVRRWPYPDDPDAVFRSTRPRVVQELASRFLDHEIDLAEAHFRLGETWFRENQREDALRELVTACELFPVVPSRFLLAGRLALEEGRPALAAELLGRGAVLDPTDPELMRWRDRALAASP